MDNTMRLKSDIDIDLGNRDALLQHIVHTPAAMLKVKPSRKHNTGVYVTAVPTDDLNDRAGIDYIDAEERGYFKLDLLNVHIYNSVRDEAHLQELMQQPDWTLLHQPVFCEQIMHIGNHYRSLRTMPQPVTSVEHMAMFLAIIRPGKRHLIGKTWDEVSQEVWEKQPGEDYAYKKSHSIAYAHLVVVHMNLLTPLWHASDKSDAALFRSLAIQIYNTNSGPMNND